MENDEAFAFWDYGPELSRPFRALDLWMQIKFAGAERLGQAIAENIACAKYLEELVKASGDFEMLAPVELSIFCFRYVPKGFTGDLDALNEELLVKVQRAGSTYLSNAKVGGRFALRGCVLNYRTTKKDMEKVAGGCEGCRRLDIQILHIQRVIFDELAATLDILAHQRREDDLALGRVLEANL